MNKKIVLMCLCAGLVVFLLLMSSKRPTRSNEMPINSSSPEAVALYEKALQFKRNRKMLEAKKAYQEILIKYSDIENISSVQKELETLNMNIILSSVVVPDRSVVHEVVVGDTLGKMAKKYGTTVELLKKSNNLKNDIIRVGQRLRVWTGKFNLLVDKSQNVLILKDDNEVIKVYSVSTGENNSTPVGTFEITTRLIDPVWFNRGAIVPPESPENVLGTRWLGFDLPGYGIHGTTEPNSIGKQETAGCVRMLNSDVEELYGLLVKGTKVTVVD